MNKITFKEIESKFKKIYKEGGIFIENIHRRYNVKVNFKKNGKVYIYNVENYAQLFNELKLGKIMYERDYNQIVKRIEENEAILKKGYRETEEDFFGINEKIYLTKEDKENLEKEIKYFNNQIEDINII